MASPTYTEEITACLEIIQNLQARQPSPLTPELLKKAKALQFVFTNKTGLGLGVTTGIGFTICKQEQREDGTAAWSAPCFLLVGSISVGATIGTQQGGSVSIMLSDKAAQLIADRGVMGKVEAEANLVVLNFVAENTAVDPLASQDVVTLGYQDGILVDLSAAVGGVAVDNAKNKVAYGRDIEPREILAGGSAPVAPPPPFLAVYDKLNQIVLGQ